jgi:aspartate aminotransferase
LTSRLDAISESQTLAMAKKVRALRAAGQPVYSFTLGEPDFDTPEHIREAAIQAIREGDTHYPPVAGQPALREAFAQHLASHYQLTYQPEEILVSTGAKQSLMNILAALVRPGDEVILPAPYWVSYLPMIQLAEGHPVIVQTTEATGLKLTPEQLEAALTARTRLLFLNSPSNPTGSIYSEAELVALAQVLERWPQVWVITDEIYALVRYVPSFFSPARLPSLRERCLVVNGVSKAFAMTGWRIGLLAAPRPVIALCEKYQGQITSGACSIAQRAATAAFSQPLDATQVMVDAFRRRRDLALQLFATHCPELTCVVPEGAFYLFPNVSAYLGRKTSAGKPLETPEQLAEWVLDSSQVAVVSGEGFGSQLHIRLSYACDEQTIHAGIAGLGDALRALRN